MNEPLMFSKSFDPFTDNRRFLKKIFRPLPLILITSGLALMLLSISYMILHYLHSSSYLSLTESASSAKAANLKSRFNTVLYLILWLELIFPFIASISAVISAKSKKEEFDPRPSIFFLTLFFFIESVVSVSLIIYSASEITSLMFYATNSSFESVYFRLLLCVISFAFPSCLSTALGISGIISCSSLKKISRGSGLINKGMLGFSRICKFLAIVRLLLTIAMIYDHFNKNEIFSLVPLPITAEPIPSLKTELMFWIMVVVYNAAAVFILFATGALSARCYRATSTANRSIAMAGVNMYMQGNSQASDYYQSTYTDSQFSDNSNAPLSTFTPDSDTSQSVSQPIDPDSIKADQSASVIAQDTTPVIGPVKVEKETLPDSITCPVCGTSNPPVCRYCNSCGNRIY